MKVVAAFLLAFLGGNTSPSAEDIKKILGSVGAEADNEIIDLLLSNVAGKDVTELIGTGREKLASVSGGGGGVISASSGGAGAAAADAPATESNKEEKEVAVEESDDETCLSLFD